MKLQDGQNMMKRFLYIFLIGIGFFVFASNGISAPEDPLLIPMLSKALKIDGILELSLWEEALKFEQFFQISPKEGGPPTEKTAGTVFSL